MVYLIPLLIAIVLVWGFFAFRKPVNLAEGPSERNGSSRFRLALPRAREASLFVLLTAAAVLGLPLWSFNAGGDLQFSAAMGLLAVVTAPLIVNRET